MERVICLLIGYVFGLFQTAYFYGKAKGIDIRKYGSGNAGTTNALRVLGTKAGLILSFHPYFIVMGVVLFFGTFLTTHYVSLGSLLVYAGFMIQMVVCGQTGLFGTMPQSQLYEMYAITAFLTVMAYWKHRQNIVRLIHGNERKTYLFKNKKSAEAQTEISGEDK